MFHHLAQLLSQFPISPGRTRQRVEEPKSNSTQLRFPVEPCYHLLQVANSSRCTSGFDSCRGKIITKFQVKSRICISLDFYKKQYPNHTVNNSTSTALNERSSQACNVVSWVRMVEREGRINLKTLPMVTEYLEQGTQTAQEGEALDEGYQGQGQGQDQGQEGAVIREELMELRERESAYKETIREADTILSMVEGGYVQKIGTLESELTALRSKVGFLH